MTNLDRITPADAGKTLQHFTPRLLLGGSPPRMRGKLRSRLRICGRMGITPADAGKTQCKHHSTGAEEDHPRGCGENPTAGTRRKNTSRITPADAGKTPSDNPIIPPFRDHPRGCGENRNAIATANKPQGSPPRMRGKRLP